MEERGNQRTSLLDVRGHPKEQEGRMTLALAVTAFFAVIGNSFTHGYNTGVLNSPGDHIKDFLNKSCTAHYSEPSAGLLELLWSITVSIYLIGGCAGAFSVGALADRFGRKKAIMIMAIPGLIGDVLFGFCHMANSLEMLIVGRLIIGFSCGAGSGLVPMYLTEIAPVNIRGAMGVLHQLALTCGILVSQLLGLRQLLGTATLWPILLAASAIPFILCCIVLPFFPDSPRWLLVKKGDEHEAEKALQRFRGEEDVEVDIQEMRNEVKEQEKEPAWSLQMLFKSKAHRIPLMVVCVLAVIQQLSGINMVFYYSDGVFKAANIPAQYTQYATLGIGTVNVIMTIISTFYYSDGIFKSVGIPDEYIQYANIGPGLTNVSFTIASVVLVEKAGRRPLLIGGMGVMVVALIVMTICLTLQEKVLWLSYISIVCTVIFVIGFAIGLGAIPQFIGAELFKQGPRPAAMSFAGLLNWAANFAVGISFPFIQIGTGPYCMLFFIVFLVVFGFVIWKYLPETKNKTFAEIAREFKIKNTGDDNDNDVPLKDFKDNGNGVADPEAVSPLLS